MIRKNKKAVSEIVSYVLLIVIAISLSVGVYSFMKFYVPKEDASTEKCFNDIALSIVDYSCSAKTIYLLLENKGLFNVKGFIIKGSNDPDIIPIIMLNTTNQEVLKNTRPGFYDFNISEGDLLKPQKVANATFIYGIPGAEQLKRISIQPYSYSEKIQDIILCEEIIEIYPKGCD